MQFKKIRINYKQLTETSCAHPELFRSVLINNDIIYLGVQKGNNFA